MKKCQTGRPSDYLVEMNTEDLYERPENIQNLKIAMINREGDYILKNDCCESYDYVVVDLTTWDYLKRWYDYDIELEVK